jgi:hypothetical protein
MRRILRKIASNETDSLGDISTLADPSVVQVPFSRAIGVAFFYYMCRIRSRFVKILFVITIVCGCQCEMVWIFILFLFDLML